MPTWFTRLTGILYSNGCNGSATMTDLADIKDAARREAKARRKAARAAHPEAAVDAMAVFLEAVSIGAEDIVSAYRPIFSELDPTPLMAALHRRGVRLCVPVITGAAQALAFRVWTPDTPMEIGAFGAEIPVATPEVIPTILIAPMLAFDRSLWRLGYGGGFYDRTLEGLRAAGKARAYGYAYAEQEVSAVPIEPTDQRLDGITTPDRFLTQ